YFKPAIPLRPVDRGTTDDAMAHFIPTDFHRGAAALIASPAHDVERPVRCSVPLVETTVIRAKQGVLVFLINWSGKPLKGLKVDLRLNELASADVKLASESSVRRDGDAYTFDLD